MSKIMATQIRLILITLITSVSFEVTHNGQTSTDQDLHFIRSVDTQSVCRFSACLMQCTAFNLSIVFSKTGFYTKIVKLFHVAK